jgi:hypothetical protein
MADMEPITTRSGKPLLPIPPSPKKKKKKKTILPITQLPKKKKKKPYKNRGVRGGKKNDEQIDDSVETDVTDDADDGKIDDDKGTNLTDDTTELKPTGKVDATKPPPTTGSESSESREIEESYGFFMSANNGLKRKDKSKKIPSPQGAPSGDSTGSEKESAESGETVETYNISMSADDDLERPKTKRRP